MVVRCYCYSSGQYFRYPSPSHLIMTQKCSVCFQACTKSCSCKKVFYCSQDCQKADRKQHKAFCPKVEERQISVEKGRGLVATREIKAGEGQTGLSD